MSFRLFKIILILFFIGAVLGPLGDLCHVLSQTTTYPKNFYRYYIFGMIPYWVPFLFGSASTLIGLGSLVYPKVSRVKNKIVTWGGIPLFLIIYGVSGILPYSLYVMYSFFFVIWFIYDRTWQGALLACLTGGIGMAVEIVLISHGLFSYNPRVLSMGIVPLWLPALYAIAFITIGNFSRSLLVDHSS